LLSIPLATKLHRPHPAPNLAAAPRRKAATGSSLDLGCRLSGLKQGAPGRRFR